jgi:hypothetical protein
VGLWRALGEVSPVARPAGDPQTPTPAGSRRRRARPQHSVFGHVLAEGGTLDTFIAGDGPEVKASVSALLKSIGLRPLDAGGLHMAQALEPLGLLLTGLARNGVRGFDFALGVDIH